MDRRKNKWIKEVSSNIGKKAKYLSPEVTVDHSSFEEQLNSCVIDHQLKKNLCIRMTKQNMQEERGTDTDVTKFYSDFNMKIAALPTKGDRK